MRVSLLGFNVFIIISLLISACDTNQYRIGERLYTTHCANCHMENGEGLSALIPTLAASDYLTAHRDQIPCIIRYGLQDTIQVNGKTYAEQMPGVPSLTEIQITNLLNFINTSWGNHNAVYGLEEVKEMLEKCKTR